MVHDVPLCLSADLRPRGFGEERHEALVQLGGDEAQAVRQRVASDCSGRRGEPRARCQVGNIEKDRYRLCEKLARIQKESRDFSRRLYRPEVGAMLGSARGHVDFFNIERCPYPAQRDVRCQRAKARRIVKEHLISLWTT